MSTCVLHLQPFDGPPTRLSISQVSNMVDIDVVDLCIRGIVATDKASA